MQLIKDIFENMARQREYNKRIEPDKAIIEGLQEKLKHAIEVTGENGNESAVNNFLDVAREPHLGRILRNYGDLMENSTANGKGLQTSLFVKKLFLRASEEVEPDEALALTRHSVVTLNNISTINDSDDDGTLLFADALCNLVKKCPQDDRLDLFKYLDARNILSNSFDHGHSFQNASFLIDAFEGVDDDKLTGYLQYSRSWDHIPKSTRMVEFFDHFGGERFADIIRHGDISNDSKHSFD